MSDAAGLELWRASFTAPAGAMPALLEPLEELATAVSVFEDEADERAETVRWRVDLLFAERPDLAALQDELQRVCAPFGVTPSLGELERVPQADWLARTAMQTAPVRAGRFFVHGRAQRGQVPAGALALQVEAGLAFGSGEHATTQACLLALDALPGRPHLPPAPRGAARTPLRMSAPRRVLDLGCGSGVLGMAAARRWPRARVTLADNDPIAVRVAAENARLNGLALRVTALASEGWASPTLRRAGPFDLVLANILADPLIAMAPALARHLAPGGIAILSGFIARDLDRVLAAHQDIGLQERGRLELAPWAALVLRAGARRAPRIPSP